MTKKKQVLLPTLFALLTPPLGLCGQFDYLYSGQDKIKNSQIEIWNKYFPGLEEQLERTYWRSKKTGIYDFESTQSPVAWNVTAANEVYINSVNSGFYMYYRDPKTFKPLFPGLKADEQGVDIDTRGDVIITPFVEAHKGFEFAISVDPNTATNITAGTSIILMAPYNADKKKYIDTNVVTVGENGQLSLQAGDIEIYGNVVGLYSSKIELQADNSILILQPSDAALETLKTIHLPITLAESEMSVNAKDILFNRRIQIGTSIFDIHHDGLLRIGYGSSEGNITDNVYFNKAVNVESSSLLQISANKSVVLKEKLNVSKNAEVVVETTSLKASQIELHDYGSSSTFNIKNDGLLHVTGEIKLEDQANLDISLGNGASMGATINSARQSTSTVKLGTNAYWFPFSSSSVTNLDLSPFSFVELGSEQNPVDIDVENLKGNGGIFHLIPSNTGAVHISNSSEGDHAVLLSSTGKSINETNYLYHTVVRDGSPEEMQKAHFYLANKGEIEAGPFVYKLDLEDFNQKGTKVWVITVAQDKLPDKPVNPDEPSVPDLPSDFPLDPEEIPDDLLPEPVGLSNAAKLVLAGISGGGQVVQSLGNLDDLRGRLGEIRQTNHIGGVYASFRYDRSRLLNQSNIKSKLDYSDYVLGVDKKLSPAFVLGANFHVAKANLKVNSSDGKMRADTVGVKLYGTWFNPQGWYMDGVLSLDRVSNRMTTRMYDERGVRGKRHTTGIGASLETGKQFKFGPDQTWFVEPQLQLSYYFIKGNHFTMSNGMKVDVKDFNSLTGRVGAVAGKRFNFGSDSYAQVYIKSGIQNEFLGKTKAYLNQFRFDDNSLGSRFYYGAGADVQTGKNFKFYGQVSRSTGPKLKNDVQVKIGFNYQF